MQAKTIHTSADARTEKGEQNATGMRGYCKEAPTWESRLNRPTQGTPGTHLWGTLIHILRF